MMGEFMGAGCIVCCILLTPEKQLLICCPLLFPGRPAVAAREGSAGSREGLLCPGRRG